MSIRTIGDEMSWGEAWRQTAILLDDPSSHLGAASAGWSRPMGREALVLMDLYDLQHNIAWVQGGKKGKKPKPYPRPWPAAAKTTTKPGPNLTQSEIIAALRSAGHTANLPTV